MGHISQLGQLETAHNTQVDTLKNKVWLESLTFDDVRYGYAISMLFYVRYDTIQCPYAFDILMLLGY